MTSFRLNEWTVDPATRMLSGEGGRQVIEPRLMAILVRLAREPGSVVSKDELTASAWPDEFVNDLALTRAIYDLRQALGDDPKAPRYIETIRKGGYRLVAMVQPVAPQVQKRKVWGWLIGVAACAAIAFAARPQQLKAPVREFPLTSMPGREIAPALSPDGTRLAFAWNGGEKSSFSIYVKELKSGRMVRVSQSPTSDSLPAWSPDGRRIAFVRNDWEGCMLMLAPSDASSEPELIYRPTLRIRSLVWSPEGKSLYFCLRPTPGAPRALWKLDLDSKQTAQLTFPPAGAEGDSEVAVSPAGRLAVIRTGRDGISEIYVLDQERAAPRQLTNDGAEIAGLSWAQGGSDILFASNRSGDFGVWRLSASGGEPAWTSLRSKSILRLSAASKGSLLAYQSAEYDRNIWRFDMGAGSQKWVATSEEEYCPALGPEGKLAFVSTSSGSPQIWLKKDADLVQLTSEADWQPSSPRWSPDGKRLLFSATRQGNSDVYCLSIHDRALERLTTSGRQEAAPSFSVDGRSFYYSVLEGKRWRIERAPMEGSAQPVVIEQEGFGCEETPEGLLFGRHGEQGLWRRDLNGRLTRLFASGWRAEQGTWSAAEEGVFFVGSGPLQPELRFFRFSTGEIQTLRQLPNLDYFGLTASRDGKSVYATQVDRMESDLRGALLE